MKKQNEKKQEWWCVDLGQAQGVPEESFLRLCEAFLRFTPDLVPGRNRIFLEMSRTKKLFNLNSISARARVLGERLGFDTTVWRLGIGKTIPLAWVQTRWRTVQPSQLPLDAYYDFVDPLRGFDLNRPMRERIAVFRALGMKSLASVFEIPKEAWLVRFGEEMDLFYENHEFGEAFPWRPFSPSLALSEETRWNADESVIDSESLIFRLKPLLDRLSERLYALHLAIRKIEIRLSLDRAVPDRLLTISFSFPQTSRVLLLKLLREKISREMERDPLTDPVVSVSLRVVETAQREGVSERFSFSEKDETAERDRERWVELIAYLGLKLQEKEDVFQVETTEHLLPEKSFKKVLFEDPAEMIERGRIAALFPKRPVRWFSEPRRVSRMGPYLRRDGDLWRIHEFSEPERLSGYEWDVEESGGFDRTYYRVRVESQQGVREEWWVFRDEREGSLCLHGVY
ncbi:MAG: hypothetical protein EBX52_03505 [Proteobacteria bacterium]|nr:hypothetical protein [Pseudomonadota bacterium]